MSDLFGDSAPNLTTTYSPGFEMFWSEYPKSRRKDKRRAYQAWVKQELEAHHLTLVSDVQRRKDGDKDWRKDGAKFVPLPATYLNGRRWEDEMTVERSARARAPAPHEQAGPTQDDPAKVAINKVWFGWMFRTTMRDRKKFTDAQIAAQLEQRDILASGLQAAWDRNDKIVGFREVCIEAFNGTL